MPPKRKKPASPVPGPSSQRASRTCRALTTQEIQCILQEDENSDPENGNDLSDSDGGSDEEFILPDTGLEEDGREAADEVSDDESDQPDEPARQPAAYELQNQDPAVLRAKTGREWTQEPPNPRVRAGRANIMR